MESSASVSQKSPATSGHSYIKCNFFTPPPYCRIVDKRPPVFQDELSLRLIASNPSKILLLLEKLNDTSSKAVEAKINNYFIKETEAKTVFLVHIKEETQEAYVQTLGKTELEETLKFSLSKDTLNHLKVFQSIQCDEFSNPEIVKILTEMFGNAKYKIIAIPIMEKQNFYPCAKQNQKILLLTCFVDTDKHEDLLADLSNELFRYCLATLLNAKMYEEEVMHRRQNEIMCTIIRTFFSKLENINSLIMAIGEESRKVTNAKKCSLFLKDPHQQYLITKVFTTFINKDIVAPIRSAQDCPVASYVVETEKLLNIEHADDHKLINKEENAAKEVPDVTILCFPIKIENETIGAVKLCNKRIGTFGYYDEEMVKALGKFGGLAIKQSLNITIREAFKVRNQISNEIMTSYITFNDERVQEKLLCTLMHDISDFESFDFSPRIIMDMESVCYVLRMFAALGFMEKFIVDRELFTKFVLFTKEACRTVPYHNWMHSFASTHFAYLCLKNLELLEKDCISDLEALAFFISCLTRNVDYKGIRNPFQEQANEVLACLYSSAGSTMERHRLSTIYRIFSFEGCNFLDSLDREQYYLFLNLIKDFNLAADLAAHYKFYDKQRTMITIGYNKNNAEHRYIFMSLLVTCADISDYSKDWSIVKQAATAMFEEFVAPVNLRSSSSEKVHLGPKSTIFFPDLQVQFYREICFPAFRLLSFMFPDFKTVIQRMKKHIFNWECSKHIFRKMLAEGHTYLEIVENKDFDAMIEETIKFVQSH